MKIEQLNSKLDDYEIIFSDIFDTIITRIVHPEYVKKIFSRRLREYYNLPITSEELYRKRFDIEARLCQKNKNNGYDLEFNFYILCEELFQEFKNMNILQEETYTHFKNVCKEVEIVSEYSTQKIDKDILKIFTKAKKNHLKVYCLSDFYLPKDMILELFKLHKIDHYFNDIFISSEYLLTKRSGRLYQKILAENFKNEKIAMIGDNKHSDIKMAKENGLDTFWINRQKQYNYYDYHLKNNQSKKHFEKKLHKLFENKQKSTDSDKVFYEEITFTLYYFISLLYFELVSKGIKDIFLFSREGEFLKRLLDIYLKINNINSINTHYLIVSRKSTFITSLKSLEEEEFETLFRQYRKMSITNFLKSLNFKSEEITLIDQSFNKDINYVEEDLPTSKIYKDLLHNIEFQKIYETKRIEQKENLISYIKSFDTDIHSNGIAIVDIGWKGTIQDHIFKLFDKKVSISGYYLGLVLNLMPDDNNKKIGLVFDYKKEDIYDKVFQENISLFEVLLGASHGSADFYQKNTKNIVEPITHQEKEEKEIFETIIHPIQETIYKKFLQLSYTFQSSHFSILDMREVVAKIHSRMIYTPTKEEIRFFKKLYHYENFGLFEFSEFNQYQTDNYVHKLKNIIKFIKSPKQFLATGFWKAATLDDIGLIKIYYIYAHYKKFKIFKGKK